MVEFILALLLQLGIVSSNAVDKNKPTEDTATYSTMSTTSTTGTNSGFSTNDPSTGGDGTGTGSGDTGYGGSGNWDTRD